MQGLFWHEKSRDEKNCNSVGYRSRSTWTRNLGNLGCSAFVCGPFFFAMVYIYGFDPVLDRLSHCSQRDLWTRNWDTMTCHKLSLMRLRVFGDDGFDSSHVAICSCGIFVVSSVGYLETISYSLGGSPRPWRSWRCCRRWSLAVSYCQFDSSGSIYSNVFVGPSSPDDLKERYFVVNSLQQVLENLRLKNRL